MARQKKPDKLAQDASAALKAGMSYGKWKALQYKPVVPVIEVQKPPTVVKPQGPKRFCEHCGKELVNKNKNAKYCNILCKRNAFYYRTKQSKEVQP